MELERTILPTYERPKASGVQDQRPGFEAAYVCADAQGHAPRSFGWRKHLERKVPAGNARIQIRHERLSGKMHVHG
jgi:hypothetical protein